MRHSTVKGLGFLAAALAGTTGAQAADLPSRAPPPAFIAAPINLDDWSGFYVGTTYGYGFNTFHNQQGGLTRSGSFDGQIGGALVGYNFQAGHVVFGAESSIDLNVIRGNIRGAGFSSAHDDSLYDIRFRGLLGYEFGAFMPFVSGGAVLNEGYMSGVGGLGNVPTWFGRNEKTIGYTVGGGLDYKFFPQQLFPGLPTFLLGPVTLRAEYLYQSLPSQTYAYGGQVYRTKSDGSFFRGALIYRFGDNPPRPYADTLGNVNWAGGYGGLFGAYAGSNVKVRVAGVGTRNIDSSGAAGGIYAGTNFMFNRLMLGFEGSTAYEDETGNRAIPIGPAGGTDNVRYRGYINADIRGRIGYAFGNFLPFLAAGYSFDRGEMIDTVTGSQRGRVPLDAFVAGGGIDFRVSQRVSFRVEDLYAFDSTTKTLNLNGVPSSVSRDGNTVRAGFAYHFE